MQEQHPLDKHTRRTGERYQAVSSMMDDRRTLLYGKGAEKKTMISSYVSKDDQ